MAEPTEDRGRRTRLTAAYERFLQRHEFEPGQIVRWKLGLRNRRKPADGEPAIVIEVLADPIEGSRDPDTPGFFREPLDLGLGVFDENDDLVIYYFDSRRFEPYV